MNRELQAVAAVSNALSVARDAESVARALLDQVTSLLDVDVTVLALVDEDRGEASGLLGFSGGDELALARDLRLELNGPPSGIARAASEKAAIAVEDAAASDIVNPGLVEATGVKSAIFVPLIAGDRVVGVVVAGTTQQQRAFSSDERAVLQAVAAEGALALDRVRSAHELDEALERDRLVARIARQVRSELDLNAVLDVAVRETGIGLGVSRCFIRLVEDEGALPAEAEWNAAGVEPVSARPERLPVTNLAARDRRTIAIADVASAPELADGTLGSREMLLDIGTKAALATPLIVFDRMIGVFTLHRGEPREWSAEDVRIAEAVAAEVALAVHVAGLLRENEERLGQLTALINAAQVVSAELRLDTVLDRLVSEVAKLLRAEAADCYLHEPAHGILRCAAVHGLDPSLVGLEAPDDAGLAARALHEGRPVFSYEYGSAPQAFPHPAYEGFVGALVAPMGAEGELSGVLGVGTRDPSRRFVRGELEAIGVFARLAGLALRNAASFEERERRARVERGFYRVASVLAQPLSLQETLGALAQAACEALGGDSSAVLMPSSGSLALVGRHELAPELENALAALPDSLVDSARAGWVLASPDLTHDDRFDERFRGAIGGRFGSLLAIPVAAEGGGPGLVLVAFEERREFSDDDLALAGHLVDAARGALERSDLFERERRARHLSQRLARVETLLTTELDPERVVDEVVSEAPALLNADACAIRIVDGDDLVVRATRGRGTNALVGSRTPLTAGLGGEVAQSRMPIVVAEVEQPAMESDPLLGPGFSGYLGVPLSGPEGGLLGVLSVYSRDPRPWRMEEVEALVALAASASAALSNAELYQRIALEKNRSDAILAHVADGIVAVDREGCVVLWNEAASQITGVAREEALGRDPSDVLKRSLAAPESAPGGAARIVSIPRGGEDVWLSLSEAVMRDPAGEVAGRIYAFRDISAERLVEQMKSDFVSTVSHQLRAPLTSIYGFAETLLRGDIDFGVEERRTFLQYIASESERLTAIVDTLLNVARLEAGDLQVTPAPIDLHAVLQDVVLHAEHDAARNAHEFVLDLPDEPLAAEADDEKLRQVLANLLDNAVKFSPEGGRVTVSAHRNDDNGTVEIAIADEGMGIPQAEHQLIFSKFYRRADRTGREEVGTGLGLFIAEGLLSAMGGSIRVSSMEGEGSRFVFELPLASAAFARRDREASPST